MGTRTQSKKKKKTTTTTWIGEILAGEASLQMASKPMMSPVPVDWYLNLSVFMLAVGIVFTAAFFIYEATSSTRNRSLSKEITTGAIASIFLGFGSLFLILATGVYV